MAIGSCDVPFIQLDFCTEPERLHHDLTTDEDPTSWNTLADILPKREFTDVVDQAPSPEELELPDLPPEPDDSTLIPIRRAHSKQTYGPQDFRRIHRSSSIMRVGYPTTGYPTTAEAKIGKNKKKYGKIKKNRKT